MIKYNDNNVIVGYIKQLLHKTYLPTIPVYKSNETCYEGGTYVKNNGIYQFKNGQLNIVEPFKFNIKAENYTKQLKLENNIYDSHTHEYLGEYLRFYRDYFNLNLMSLYNCFSDRIPENMIIETKDEEDNTVTLYSTSATDYKLYIVPIKFSSKYSIYIDCVGKLELTTILYDKGYYDVLNSKKDLAIGCQKIFNGTSFNRAIKYSSPDSLDDTYSQYLPYEEDLKLLIKIPFNVDSSIVIFENDLTTTQDVIHVGEENKNVFDLEVPKTVINHEKDLDTSKIPLGTRSQLTYINSKVSHPFADRLLEYLTDNAITPLDKISDNIARVQHELYRRPQEKVTLAYITNEGIWDDSYKGILYEVAEKEGLIDSKFDILGYVDKDVERKLGEDYDLYENTWYEEDD